LPGSDSSTSGVSGSSSLGGLAGSYS